MLEVVIESIRVSLMNYQRVVILKERDVDRYLPIWIGSPEADAIAVKLQEVTVQRPLTHDLLGAVISALGARVDRVVVSDLNNGTFFAKLIVLQQDGTECEVDCRPSDAIAVAVRGGVLAQGSDGHEHSFETHGEAEQYLREIGNIGQDEITAHIRSKVPIFVVEAVLDKAGVVIDGDDSSSLASSTRPESRRERSRRAAVTDEELKSMSAFSDFLQELPGLEELGKSEDESGSGPPASM